MDRDAIAARLHVFVSGDLLGDLEVAVDDDLLTDGLLDSLAVVRLVAFIDEDLRIAVPPQDITVEHFSSISAMADYLATL